VAGADPRPAHLVPAGWWTRRAIEAVGWLLAAAGLAALVLPGPGLLFLVAGLAVLSPRYPWAKRILVPVKARAILLAARGAKTWPRIVLRTLLIYTFRRYRTPSVDPKSDPTP
jgi:hypothetical protein